MLLLRTINNYSILLIDANQPPLIKRRKVVNLYLSIAVSNIWQLPIMNSTTTRVPSCLGYCQNVETVLLPAYGGKVVQIPGVVP
jgi:hypothetical protein